MILSHRWKNVWRSLTGLRFHVRLPCDVHLEDFSIHSTFVSHFLSHRDASAPVHDFHLSFDGPSPHLRCRPCGGVDREFLEVCVLYAINHGVQSLRLHWPADDKLMQLPAAFLTCETLRELELRNMFYCPVKLPGRLSLPNLKTILLHSFVFEFDDYDHRRDPFSGLPQLEKLTLINFICHGLYVLKAPKLRLLQIDNHGYFTFDEISAPLLTSFTWKSRIVWECARVNLPMLEQVYFDIHDELDYRFDHIRGYDTDIVTMLHPFGNATTVSLSVDTLEMVEWDLGYYKQTPFPNMKCLKVMKGGSRNRRVFQGVINYLTRNMNCEVEFSSGLFVTEHMIDEEMY